MLPSDRVFWDMKNVLLIVVWVLYGIVKLMLYDQIIVLELFF